MFHLRAFFSICLILFAGNLYGQVKITEDMKAFPPEFMGHDPTELANGLAKLFKNKSNQPKDIKDKKVYGELMVGDLFAFKPKVADYKGGRFQNTRLRFWGSIYPMIGLKDFPEPRQKSAEGDGSGIGIEYGSGSSLSSGSPHFTSFNDIAAPYGVQAEADSIWASNYLPLGSNFAPGALDKKYAAQGPVCSPSPSDSVKPNCVRYGFYLPSPQIHYGLVFAKKPNLPLIKVVDRYLDLATYKFQNRELPGVAAWTTNGEKYENGIPVFVVRLVPPYFATQEFSVEDPVEKAPYIVTRNLFYVELVGVWIHRWQAGTVVSRDGGVAAAPDPNAPPKSLTDTDKEKNSSNGDTVGPILRSVPNGVYTTKARNKRIEGTVKLRVTFMASGEIGQIEVVKALPDGLTEQAVKAARKIKFVPATSNGVPITVTKTIEYSFLLY